MPITQISKVLLEKRWIKLVKLAEILKFLKASAEHTDYMVRLTVSKINKKKTNAKFLRIASAFILFLGLASKRFFLSSNLRSDLPNVCQNLFRTG